MFGWKAILTRKKSIQEITSADLEIYEGVTEPGMTADWREEMSRSGCLIDDARGIRNWGIRNSTLKEFGIGGDRESGVRK